MFPANKQHEHKEHEKEYERKRLLSNSSSPGGYSYSSVPTPSSSSPYYNDDNNNSYYRSMKRHPPQDAPGALSHSIPSTTRYERNSDYDYRSAFREIDRINKYNNDETMNYGNGYNNNNDDDEELFREKRKKATKDTEEREGDSIPSILIYTAINTIMCVPCLYGYSSVIFNNDVFQPHMDALSKLVLFSSIIHQICFTLFSSLPFAIGQVQDAGLIFLSIMSNTMANKLISEASQSQTSDLDIEEIISTVLVLLGVATSCLGLVLIVIGKFKLADLVAYLPLPVVGGYLAFIGYFCVEAGVSVCIQKSIVNLSDWSCLFSSSSEDNNLLMLAIPSLICGILFMIFARMDNSDVVLPTSMVLLPIAFYLLIMFGIPDYNIEMARQDGWLGPHSNKIPAKDVFNMIHLDKVRWDMIPDILPTWVGMVFVVTFSSCLDVAAISMGLGEVLDVNNELTTVGISNLCSGILCGQTGSYIFSQTIFTMRAGLKTRWAGILLIFTELAVFLATTSVLEVTPLFFLGGTLTFIGFDLLYEWLVEVRHKLLLSEYVIVLCTFIAIFIFGINGGILVGIIHSALDYIMVTAKASTLTRVVKRSRAVWNQEEWKFLDQNYQEQKIVTFEIKGNVFFGSSLQLFSELTNDISIHDDDATGAEEDRDRFIEMSKVVAASPLHFHNDVVKSSPFINNDKNRRNRKKRLQQQERKNPRLTELHQKNTRPKKTPTPPSPDFVVLDLKEMQNVDASAARGCFLQLAKMCSKRGIILMASNATPHVDWLLRSHDAAFPITEQKKEEEHKKTLLFKQQQPQNQHPSFTPLNKNENEKDESSTNSEKIILFETLEEALEFCESCLMERFYVSKSSSSVVPMTSTTYNNNNNNDNNRNEDEESPRLPRRVPSACALSQMCDGVSQHKYTLSCVFHQYLGLKDEEVKLLENYDKNTSEKENLSSSLHEEICLKSGEVIFQEGEHSNAFYLILSGSVVLQKNQPNVYERDISSSSHFNNTNNNFEEDNNNAMQLGGDNHQYHNTKILSGAGPIIHHTPAAAAGVRKQESYNNNESNSSDRNRSLMRLGSSSSSSSKKYLRLGSLFGFVSYILEKKRNFSAIARNDDTIVAKISRDTLSRLSRESSDLEKLVVKLLLQASTRELDNVQDL